MNTKKIISIILLVIIGIIIGWYLSKTHMDPNKQADVKNPHAILTTSMGVIELELYQNKTPKTVENFITLAKSNFYDGTKFHRVIPGFMIQGGDPLTKDDTLMKSWGTGGASVNGRPYQFNDEFVGLSNFKGTISMANSGPNTNSSQFFINTVDNNMGPGIDDKGLDNKHTVFGYVVKGFDIAEAISNTERGPNDIPKIPIVIEKVEIKEME